MCQLVVARPVDMTRHREQEGPGICLMGNLAVLLGTHVEYVGEV